MGLVTKKYYKPNGEILFVSPNEAIEVGNRRFHNIECISMAVVINNIFGITDFSVKAFTVGIEAKIGGKVKEDPYFVDVRQCYSYSIVHEYHWINTMPT